MGRATLESGPFEAHDHQLYIDLAILVHCGGMPLTRMDVLRP